MTIHEAGFAKKKVNKAGARREKIIQLEAGTSSETA